MIKRFILVPLFLLSQLLAEDNVTAFTQSNYYLGFGWKTFQLGSVYNETAVVNGDGILLILGKYYPKYDLKIEVSASALGYLEYKLADGSGYNNDIQERDYGINIAYGGGHRNDILYMFPHFIVGAGAKVITDELAGTFTLPMLQAGVGLSVRHEKIEFFVKYYYDVLFNTQTFTTTNGDTIDMNTVNGSLEVGLNYLF